jgi:hypothetical protein
MAAGLLSAIIDRLSLQFPRLVFKVMQAPLLELQYRDLRERAVDLFLGRIVTPAELLNESWFLPAYDSLIGSRFVEAFCAQGLDVPRHTVVSESAQLHTALLAIAGFWRAFGFDAVAERQAVVIEGLAGGVLHSPRPGRHRHVEGSNRQSGGAALHRPRPGSRKAIGRLVAPRPKM